MVLGISRRVAPVVECYPREEDDNAPHVWWHGSWVRLKMIQRYSYQSSSCRIWHECVSFPRPASTILETINRLTHHCRPRSIFYLGNIDHFWRSLMVDMPFWPWWRIIPFQSRVDLCNRAQCFIEADHDWHPANSNRGQLHNRGGVQCRIYHEERYSGADEGNMTPIRDWELWWNDRMTLAFITNNITDALTSLPYNTCLLGYCEGYSKSNGVNRPIGCREWPFPMLSACRRAIFVISGGEPTIWVSVWNVRTLVIRRDKVLVKRPHFLTTFLKIQVTSDKSQSTTNVVQIFLPRLKKGGSATLRLSVPAWTYDAWHCALFA